jgi:hypothetical protein
VGALSTPGTSGALLTECRARPAPAASRRPVPTPRPNIPSRGATIHGASTRVHAIHPSGLPLTRDLHDGTEILRLSPGLRTPPLPATHAKEGARQRARARGYTTDFTPVLLTASPLAKCDLVSQRQMSAWQRGHGFVGCAPRAASFDTGGPPDPKPEESRRDGSPAGVVHPGGSGHSPA